MLKPYKPVNNNISIAIKLKKKTFVMLKSITFRYRLYLFCGIGNVRCSTINFYWEKKRFLMINICCMNGMKKLQT